MQWLSAVTLIAAALVGGCDMSPAVRACERGQAAAREGKYAEAVEALTRCLASSNVAVEERARAYEARAWAYANSAQDRLAVTDQEAAFALKPPDDYRQFINYASYLRAVRRYEDSLRALRSAESFEKGSGKPSMMTQ